MNQNLRLAKYSALRSAFAVSACASLLALVSLPASAQIFRCAGATGITPEYINNAKEAQQRGCKAMQGGNVTVMQGAPAAKSALRVASNNPTSLGPRTDSSPEQKARDSDSRVILQSELKKAEIKLAEQQKEYNNGDVEKQVKRLEAGDARSRRSNKKIGLFQAFYFGAEAGQEDVLIAGRQT